MSELYDNEDRFRKFLNRNEWQHTWHLPKSNNGDVNWFSDETKEKVLRILKDEELGLRAEYRECSALIKILEEAKED